jgi:predicted component of type VI protein secretion system
VFACLALLCAALSACGSGDADARVDSYLTTPGSTTVTLTVIAGPGATAHAEILEENDSEVVMKVRVKESDDVNVKLGVPYSVIVTLSDPLGNRAVRTDHGAVVPSGSPSAG